MKKSRWVAIGILGLSLLLTGCGRPSSEPEEQPTVPVEVIGVTLGVVDETTTLTGVLEGYRAVDVVSEVSGKIESLRKDSGDRVSAADILASVERKVARETLNQASAVLSATRARYEISKNTAERDSTLYASNATSSVVYENSLLARSAARADVQAAEAARELAARQLAETDIRSPFSGLVSRRTCEIGSYVSPGMPIFRVIDIDSLRLRLGISQSNVSRLRPGMVVRVTTEALEDQVFTGRVRSVSPEADEMTRTFTIEVILANPEGYPLRDGLVVKATLVLETREDVIAVPREVVLDPGRGGYVFVVEDSVVRRRDIRLGKLIDSHYIVEKGLAAGERVVTAGMQNLRDGTPIRIEVPGPEPSPLEEPSS